MPLSRKQQALFKDGVQSAVDNNCLNLHVQVGTLSPSFDIRTRRLRQPTAQIRFPKVKESVRHVIYPRTPQTIPSLEEIIS